MEFVTGLLDTSDFPARWRCGHWTPAHGWLHILSDAGVWAAYFAIPLVLGYFVSRRRDLPFRRVFLLFVAFILLCGTTHLMEAVIFWWPAYRLAGLLKLLTAVVSWVTVFALVRVAPAVLAMRTPEELEREVAARVDAERRLIDANAVLERRVEERTADLGLAVAALQRERELLHTTLMSIGDAVITTDAAGRITGLNGVAEVLTGWTNAESQGQPLDAVFRIVNETTRLPVENPAIRALKEGTIVGLANHTVLIGQDGRERPIDDSAAPIRNKEGEVIGGVLVFRDIGEQKRLERERQEAQERVVAALESVTDGFTRFDRDWRIVYVNSEAERLTGRLRSELIGKSHWDEFPTTVGSPLEAEYRRAMTERVTVEFEHYFDPLGRWFAVKGDPAPDGGLTVFFRDITDRKQAENVLRQSEARFRAGIEAVSSIVWTNDARGQMVGEQAGWGKFTGQDRESYQGYGWSRAVHPDDAQPTIDAWNEAVAAKQTFVFEHRVRRFDGQWRICSIRAVPVFDARGEIGEWVGVHTDFTESKRAEAVARESEERFRMLADNIPQLAWIADAGTDGQVHWFNRNWFEYTGTTLEEMRGAGWHAVHHPEHAERVIEKFSHHVKASLDWEDTFPLRGKDGRFRWFLSRMKVIRDDSGKAVRIFGTNTDITEQRDTAEVLQKLTADLKDADRRKDEFLATLAHELRNPLAPIRNGLQVIRMAGASGTIEQARSMMERQLTQMVRLVDDLLDVSRVTTGKLTLSPERLELRAVIEAALETSRPVIEQAGHDLDVSIPDEPIFVEGDLTRLAQVVSNLLTNSAKYTHRGGHLRLSVVREGGKAAVSVSDDGIGIPPAMLGRVFEMFIQVDRTLEKTTGGLGPVD